jgi:excisionase family DNA binding protein
MTTKGALELWKESAQEHGMPETTPDTVLTVSEVSEYLRLGESTIYRLAKDGKLPARKVGGVWRFSQKSLDAWLAQMPADME